MHHSNSREKLHRPQEQQQQQQLATLVTSLNQQSGQVHLSTSPLNLETASQHLVADNVIFCDSLNIGEQSTSSKNNRTSRNNDERFGIYIKTETNFCIIGTLLGFSLCTSILNTFLLSFIIKSIQLGEKGLLLGNLHTNLTSGQVSTSEGSYEPLGASIISELPIRMSDDKILLFNQILASDSDLRLHPIGPDDYLSLQATTNNELNTPSRVTIRERQLELTSAKLSIQLISESSQHLNPSRLLANGDSDGFHPYETSKRQSQVPRIQKTGATDAPLRLMEFDEKQNLVTLDELSKLDDYNFNKPISSLELDNELDVGNAAVIGTLDHNLELQARNGDLNCRGGDTLRLVSKTADLRLVSGSRLHANAPKLVLSSKRGLHLKQLVELVDVAGSKIAEDKNVPNQERRSTLPPTADNLESSTHQQFTDAVADAIDVATNIAAASSTSSIREPQGMKKHPVKQEQEQEHDDESGEHGIAATKRQRNSLLQAYELIIVNGVLMASA